MPFSTPSVAGYPVTVLGASAAGWSHTGDTNETKLTSVTVPANTIGLGTLEIITLWTFTNNADSKAIRVRFGAADDLTGTTYIALNVASNQSAQQYTAIRNRATNSQIGYGNVASSFGVSGSLANITSAVDTTAVSYVVFSGQDTASAADTVTLEAYVVRLIPAV